MLCFEWALYFGIDFVVRYCIYLQVIHWSLKRDESIALISVGFAYWTELDITTIEGAWCASTLNYLLFSNFLFLDLINEIAHIELFLALWSTSWSSLISWALDAPLLFLFFTTLLSRRHLELLKLPLELQVLLLQILSLCSIEIYLQVFLALSLVGLCSIHDLHLWCLISILWVFVAAHVVLFILFASMFFLNFIFSFFSWLLWVLFVFSDVDHVVLVFVWQLLELVAAGATSEVWARSCD